MDLSIITVTWNSKEYIIDQIRSVISGCKNITFEQIIVDNGSSDGTIDLVRKEFPKVKIIQNTENKGFAYANNQAVKIAAGDFLLFLNPDMRVEAGSLDTILAWMKSHSDIGIASCKLTDRRGNFNVNAKPRRFPTVWSQLAIVLKIPHLFPFVLDQYQMKDFDAEKEQEVDSVRGSFSLVRRSVIETLGHAFDPRYYIWFEDVDLCREVKRLGMKVVYTPIISCVDIGGVSFHKRHFFWKQWQFVRSMTRYFWKWGI